MLKKRKAQNKKKKKKKKKKNKKKKTNKQKSLYMYIFVLNRLGLDRNVPVLSSRKYFDRVSNINLACSITDQTHSKTWVL